MTSGGWQRRKLHRTKEPPLDRVQSRHGFRWLQLLFLLFVLGAQLGCRKPPVIAFTDVPREDFGGPDSQGRIAGRVTNAKRGDRVMLFAKADQWWVQPDVDDQLTPIAEDGTWSAKIHLGHKYAALVVRGDFAVEASGQDLPKQNGHIIAASIVDGRPSEIMKIDRKARVLQFSGQEWDDTFHAGEYGGKNHFYLPQNAYVDSRGLHLKIVRVENQWTCSEVKLARALGYGTYRMKFSNPQALEPAVEFGFFSMDTQSDAENYREMDVHLSRWGDPHSLNAEYAVQPYYVAANVHRFELPPGQVISTFVWSPEQAVFSTEVNGKPLTTWKFTAGVPSSLNGHIYFSLCAFGYPKEPLQHDTELVVDQFEYLP